MWSALFTAIFDFLKSFRSSKPEVPVTAVTPTAAPQPSAFKRAELFVKKAEGGWYAGTGAGDPNPTNFGITQKTYDAYRKSQSLALQTVHDIEEPEVEDIYGQYWQTAQCDDISMYSEKLAIIHFDTSFNSGPHEGALLLQRAVGANVDGKIGATTLTLVQQKTATDEVGTLTAYMTSRLSFMKSLHNWDSWGKVWSKRLNSLAVYVDIPWRVS